MQRSTVTWLVVGAIVWGGLIAIGAQLAASGPGRLAFDLELLLVAGREVAAGRSPYDPAMLAGDAPLATSLFYSYPPPVAQAMALFSGLSSGVAMWLWTLGALTGLGVVAEALRRRLAPARRSRDVVIAVIAGAPLVLPFAVGILFGNADIWFPTLYGAMLVAALSTTRWAAIGGGIALALAALKLHPASVGIWFLVVAIVERSSVRGRPAGWVVIAAALCGLAIVGISLLVGGAGPWLEYADVVRAGAGSAIVDRRNAALAALLAGALGLDDAAARTIHLGVGALAVAVTVWAAWKRRDPVESFGWATVASLATLPVTWYHYPSALIPVALAALLRASPEGSRRVHGLIIGAGLCAAVALVWLPLVWAAAGLVILAARASADDRASVAPAAG